MNKVIHLFIILHVLMPHNDDTWVYTWIYCYWVYCIESSQQASLNVKSSEKNNRKVTRDEKNIWFVIIVRQKKQ